MAVDLPLSESEWDAFLTTLQGPARVIMVRAPSVTVTPEERIAQTLRALNLRREAFARSGHSLVIWIRRGDLRAWMTWAPDLFAARSGLFDLDPVERLPRALDLVGGGRDLAAELALARLESWDPHRIPPEELRRRGELYERRAREEQAKERPPWPRLVQLYRELGQIYQWLGEGQRAAASWRAMAHACRKALEEADPEKDPALPASLYQSLGEVETRPAQRRPRTTWSWPGDAGHKSNALPNR